MNEPDGSQSGSIGQDSGIEMEITMKKLVIAALAATTALTGVMSAGVAAAQPGPYGDHDRRDDRRDYDRRDDRRGDQRAGDHDRGDRRDWNRADRGYERNWNGWYSQDRWSHGDHRFYGGRYGYNGYRGHWRTGERYPYWRENRYVINDYRAYRLPPPRAGYRYYRDDNGDIVMAAVTSGVIGLIIGSALHD
jgi:Ni/Co efflux regulator RcnB